MNVIQILNIQFVSYYILLFIITLVPILIAVAYLILAERKVMASIQRRKGPNVVGLFGLLQPFIDAVKLLLKEHIYPTFSNFWIFLISPLLTLIISLLGWAFIPFQVDNFYYDFNFSLLFLLTFSSIGIYGVSLSGWASNSKFAILGAIRTISQFISYELILTISILPIIFLTNSLNLIDIVNYQIYTTWFLLPLWPIAYIFFISALAETNRTPFDLPEAEAELVAGYNVEYSSVFFIFFMFAEYNSVLIMSTLFSLLFLGGWDLIFFQHEVVLAFKISIISFFFIVIRATQPRFRFDQLLSLCWKKLLPLSFSLFLLYIGLYVFLLNGGFFDLLNILVILGLLFFGYMLNKKFNFTLDSWIKILLMCTFVIILFNLITFDNLLSLFWWFLSHQFYFLQTFFNDLIIFGLLLILIYYFMFEFPKLNRTLIIYFFITEFLIIYILRGVLTLDCFSALIHYVEINNFVVLILGLVIDFIIFGFLLILIYYFMFEFPNLNHTLIIYFFITEFLTIYILRGFLTLDCFSALIHYVEINNFVVLILGLVIDFIIFGFLLILIYYFMFEFPNLNHTLIIYFFITEFLTIYILRGFLTLDCFSALIHYVEINNFVVLILGLVIDFIIFGFLLILVYYFMFEFPNLNHTLIIYFFITEFLTIYILRGFLTLDCLNNLIQYFEMCNFVGLAFILIIDFFLSYFFLWLIGKRLFIYSK